MCGIVGLLDIKSMPDRVLLKEMCDVIRHRGPDGEGIYIDGSVGLGHRRLSIIDLEGGKQPMSNENGSIWITYNGEIYNFKGLRLELESKGHKFRTKSDTEVIIHAYEEYGEECVKKLRGMFAFGIWDLKNRRLFLARDRLGKKPLYYFFDGTCFIFASEIKAILKYKGIPREMDLTALLDYFIYMYIPFPKTIFKNIFKLPPAHYMTVRIVRDVGNVRNVQDDRIARTNEVIKQLEHLKLSIDQYWDLTYDLDYSMSEDDWIEGLREKLFEAVRIRLVSDVPLGAFLSGGIDSSAIVALMSQISDRAVKTFSIGFEEGDFSELNYARIVAKQYGTEHHEMIVRPDAIEVLPRLAWEFDEPFADSSAIPTYYVSKMARENVTVILSGDGGDETFAGYRRYASACRFNNRMSLIPSFFRRWVFGGISSLMPYGLKGKGFLGHLALNPFKYYKGMITMDEPKYLKNLFSDEFKRGIGMFSNTSLNSPTDKIVNTQELSWHLEHSDMFLQQFYNRYPNADHLTKMQYLDIKTYLAEDILTKVDRASMLCSLETRTPLLDHKLQEFVAKMPSSLKLRNGRGKYIFKKAMEGKLPRQILYREKMGFGVPLKYWFKKDLVGYAKDILLEKRCRDRGFFNSKHIEHLINSHQLRNRDLSQHIWHLLFFEHWCRVWLDA